MGTNAEGIQGHDCTARIPGSPCSRRRLKESCMEFPGPESEIQSKSTLLPHTCLVAVAVTMRYTSYQSLTSY